MNQFLAKICFLQNHRRSVRWSDETYGDIRNFLFLELLSLKPSSSASGRLVLRSKVKSNELSLNGGHFFP